MDVTKRMLAIEAARGIEEAAKALRELLEQAPPNVPDDEILAACDIGSVLFEMSRSIEGLATDKDEPARNFWLTQIAREAGLRSGVPNEGVDARNPDAFASMRLVVQKLPKGAFARLRFGACFHQLSLGSDPQDWTRAVDVWTGMNKWAPLAAIWKKISGVAVSADTMKVGFSTRKTRGKRG